MSDPADDKKKRAAFKKIITGYYAATPGFAILDYFLGVNIRVAGFIGWPALRGLYYFFCLACLGIILKRPRHAPYAVFFESVLNIFILILGVLVPIFNLQMALDNPEVFDAALSTPAGILNFFLAGSTCYLTYRTSEAELVSRWKDGEW